VTPGVNLPYIKGVLHHAALPILSQVVITGGIALQMRGNSIRVLGEDYLRVARLRGLSDYLIATRYVGRNAVLPIYTGLMISIGAMFGGAVVLETIFKYRGMGYYLVRAVQTRDFPLMMGAFTMIAVAVVIALLIADITYGQLDPRAGRGEV
jgi:peptide/nickel transport system permease protein